MVIVRDHLDDVLQPGAPTGVAISRSSFDGTSGPPVAMVGQASP